MKKGLLTIPCFLFSLCAFAQLAPTRLSVFSNGTFFEQKEGILPFNNNKAIVDLPGTILSGTFWLTGENNIRIKQINVSIDTIKKVKQSQFIDDFLVGNEGRTMTLRFTQKQLSATTPLRSVSGTLVSFNSLSGLIKFKTLAGKIMLINADNLNDIDLELGANETFKDDTLIRRAKIMLDKPASQAPLHQVSIQKGLQWQPSYFVKLENDTEARIVIKATVENGTGFDYKEIDLDLVVGNPQLFFGSQTDPVSDFYIPAATETNTYTWDFEGGYGRGNNRNIRRGAQWNDYRAVADSTYAVNVTDVNGASTTRMPRVRTKGKLFETIFGSNGQDELIKYNEIGNVAINYAEMDITGDKDYSSAGKKSADLYYYHAGKVSLPIGAKTLLPVSQSTISYKHIYEATIGDITNYANNKTVLVDEAKAIDVLHSLKLTNKTTAPLTEAPIFIVNENEDPIAQDFLNYTPINEEVSIKLSKAIDISVKSKELEQGKEEKAKKFGRKNYDKVTLKGTLDVANFLDKPITLTLKKALRGEVTQPDNGAVTKPGRFLAINPISLIKWDIELKAGEKKTITYEYEVYIAP